MSKLQQIFVQVSVIMARFIFGGVTSGFVDVMSPCIQVEQLITGTRPTVYAYVYSLAADT